MNWNWADGKAYYDGAPGTIGKLSLMALFPPAAYVFGTENLVRGTIRYHDNPTLCNAAWVFADGVLLFLPVASFLKGGGSGLAGSGGAAVLTGMELQQIQQAVQGTIGIRILGNYLLSAPDPSGQGGGGPSNDLELALRLKDSASNIKRLAPNSKDYKDLGLEPLVGRDMTKFAAELYEYMKKAKTIHFDLTGMRDINSPGGVLRGPAGYNDLGSTNWELRTIWDEIPLRDITRFYRDSREITPAEVLTLP